ncbi:hypothetical protein U0070_024574 [Myodes glareolus]|uniref:Uncharacterized protein n=1 Tax=Myodes glareolus TaxID=447135 RepID=A0AAW0IDE8_MYOGA
MRSVITNAVTVCSTCPSTPKTNFHENVAMAGRAGLTRGGDFDGKSTGEMASALPSYHLRVCGSLLVPERIVCLRRPGESRRKVSREKQSERAAYTQDKGVPDPRLLRHTEESQVSTCRMRKEASAEPLQCLWSSPVSLSFHYV